MFECLGNVFIEDYSLRLLYFQRADKYIFIGDGEVLKSVFSFFVVAPLTVFYVK